LSKSACELLDERVDLILQGLVALAERNLALQVENRHFVDDPFLDLHARLLNIAARGRRRNHAKGVPAASPNARRSSANSRKTSP
jgi:hypothetical protein